MKKTLPETDSLDVWTIKRLAAKYEALKVERDRLAKMNDQLEECIVTLIAASEEQHLIRRCLESRVAELELRTEMETTR